MSAWRSPSAPSRADRVSQRLCDAYREHAAEVARLERARPSAGATRCAAAVAVEPPVGAAVSESTLPPQWLTAEQLAIYLSVSAETLKYWRAHARGPRYHKIGRRVRYAKADVDSWVATCAVGSPTGVPV